MNEVEASQSCSTRSTAAARPRSARLGRGPASITCCRPQLAADTGAWRGGACHGSQASRRRLSERDGQRPTRTAEADGAGANVSTAAIARRHYAIGGALAPMPDSMAIRRAPRPLFRRYKTNNPPCRLHRGLENRLPRRAFSGEGAARVSPAPTPIPIRARHPRPARGEARPRRAGHAPAPRSTRRLRCAARSAPESSCAAGLSPAPTTSRIYQRAGCVYDETGPTVTPKAQADSPLPVIGARPWRATCCSSRQTLVRRRTALLRRSHATRAGQSPLRAAIAEGLGWAVAQREVDIQPRSRSLRGPAGTTTCRTIAKVVEKIHRHDALAAIEFVHQGHSHRQPHEPRYLMAAHHPGRRL